MEKRYKTVVLDPPWKTTTGPRWASGDAGHNPLPYPTMSMEEIEGLPVDRLADDAAHLYLWLTNKLVPQGYSLVKHWGFKPGTLLTWCKTPMGVGLGDAFAITTEFVLFAHRGGLRPKTRIPSTWWNWKRGRHSQKPEAFIDIVEQVSTGPFLEVFARRNRLGWDTFGNQCIEHVKI